MRLFGWKNRTTFTLLFKCLGVLSFLGICIAVVACGNTNQVAPGTPVATMTINLNQSNSSPTPPLKDYYCGAWATNTTPAYGPNNTVNVYAKFTHTLNNNPVGVGGATAVAHILWPDGSVDTQTVQTTSDGLAVFTILIRASALNHEVLIPVTFTTPDGQHTCTTPAAFFVAVVVSPTATPSPSPGQGGNQGSPTASPSPGGNGGPPGTPSASPTKKPGH